MTSYGLIKKSVYGAIGLLLLGLLACSGERVQQAYTVPTSFSGYQLLLQVEQANNSQVATITRSFIDEKTVFDRSKNSSANRQGVYQLSAVNGGVSELTTITREKTTEQFTTDYVFTTATTGRWTEKQQGETLRTGSFSLAPLRYKTDAQGDSQHTITVDGQTREYYRHLPPNFNQHSDASLFVVLHGQQSHAKQMRDYTNFNHFADQNNVVAVYPESLEGPLPFFNNQVMTHWDVYFLEEDSGFNDVGFIQQLVSELTASHNIAADKVYVGGFSNGSAFAQRLVCELPNTFAGMVAVGFSAVEQTVASCPKLNMPVVFVRGTVDPITPFEGFEGYALDSVTSAEKYAKLNDCASQLDPLTLPDKDPKDKSQMTQIDFTDCVGGTAVRFYQVEQGGHTWPSAPIMLDEAVFGLSNNDIDFNQEAWQFLLEHQADRGHQL